MSVEEGLAIGLPVLEGSRLGAQERVREDRRGASTTAAEPVSEHHDRTARLELAQARS